MEQQQLEQHSQIWQNWAESLHRWGLENLAAAFLEASEPLNLVGAQFVYAGQPLLNGILPQNHLEALANMLETPHQTRAFLETLRNTNLRKAEIP